MKNTTDALITNPSHEGFFCISCGMDTWDEYYMLHLRIWKKVNPKIKGMLCIKCVESRLGRKLSKKDFRKVLLNTDKDTKRTPILKNRLNREE